MENNGVKNVTKEKVLEILNEVNKDISKLSHKWHFQDTVRRGYADVVFYKQNIGYPGPKLIVEIFNGIIERVKNGEFEEMDNLVGTTILDEIYVDFVRYTSDETMSVKDCIITPNDIVS